MRASNSRTSSTVKRLSIESIGTSCRTVGKPWPSGSAPPTRCVGLSGVTSEGCSDSRRTSSAKSASYSASESSGFDST